MRNHALRRLARISLAPAAAAAAIVSEGAAFAANDCHTTPAVVTAVTERDGANCVARHTCGFVIVHWSGGMDCHHFNIRERSGSQFEAPGTNRNQLGNKRSAAFPGKFGSNNTIHVMVQACTKPVIGSSHCTGWSAAVDHDVEPMAGKVDPKREAQCRTYATRAATEAKFVRDNHCDPKVYSGPRWSLDFNEHLRWCMTAPAAQVNFENRERIRMSTECRKGPSTLPKGGTPAISVSVRGDTFTVTGSGFPPNAPVIIRATGPGAAIPAGLTQLSITVNQKTKERIVADAQGRISVTIFGAQLCKRGGGRVNLTAEDQDRAIKASGSGTCPP